VFEGGEDRLTPSERIEAVKAAGHDALTEAEAKRFLAAYGIPVVAELTANDAEEAAERADAIGFPVVLKGLGAKLTHKTERGLVRLNLKDRTDVTRAAGDIAVAAGRDLEGFLVQPMLAGKREFVAGMIRDERFGPVIMFGLGGVYTEALRDVTFRFAPLDQAESGRMPGELKSSALLGDFRGETAVDRNQIVRVLTGLSRLALEHPEVAEIDINPLLIGPDGRVCAVDALVVLGGSLLPDSAPRDLSFLDTMLAPRSIAIIGARRSRNGGWQNLMRVIAGMGYTGRLYPINPGAAEIEGIRAYPSLRELPEPVDLVIVAVAATMVPAALEECIATGNRNVHIFAAGFKETGEEEGLRLQREIEEIAIRGGLNVMGPNCMGLYNPALRLATWRSAPTRSGDVAFVSQSGGHAGDLAALAERAGVYFSKAISYGNALTLDSTDFLEYLKHDDQTRIICLYLEGIRDGRRLSKQIAEINPRKPVIIMKGGLTESGARAVASHTGSLAGGPHLWETLFRQTGAVRVDSLEEMADVVLAFRNLGKPAGRRVAVIGTGGGIGVWAADAIARAGLELPILGEKTQAEFRAFIPEAGNILRNPIDAGIAFTDLGLLERALRIISADPLVDAIVITIHVDWTFNFDEGRHIDRLAHYLAGPAREHTAGKPYLVSWQRYRTLPGIVAAADRLYETLINGGVPLYEGLPRAASALSRVVVYYEFQRNRSPG